MNILNYPHIFLPAAATSTPTGWVLSSQFTFCHVLNDTLHDSKATAHFKTTLRIKIRPAITSGTTSASNPVVLPAVNKL